MGRVPSKGRNDRAKRQSEAAAILERRPELADKKLLRDKEIEAGAEYSTDLRGKEARAPCPCDDHASPRCLFLGASGSHVPLVLL